MSYEYLILVIIFLMSIITRTSYEILKDKGKINPENKLIFISIFIVMCLLWSSWFALCPKDPYPIYSGLFIRWFGFSIFAIGMLIAIIALIQIKALENTKKLITTGLYKKFRHPMYIGFILWIAGWSIFNGAYISFAFGIPCIINIIYWKIVEEKRLVVKYGTIYQEYMKRTWF
jgi:protein-S-isoprenylcysteine O-methyltransferase Ste14